MAEGIVLQENLIFSCVVDSVLHPNKEEERGRLNNMEELWTVFRTTVRVDKHYETRLCSGMGPKINKGDAITMTGSLIDNGKYGIQYRFNAIQKQIPTERYELATFLSKNISGVKDTTALKIVEELGENAVEKISEDYKCLVGIKGISEKKAIKIYNQIIMLHSSIDELKFFSKTGLGPSRIGLVKAYYIKVNKEKNKPVNIIEDISRNPYELIENIDGIGFKIADSVALKIGFANDDERRIRAGIKYALKEEVETKGNIWITKDDLAKLASGKNYLSISIEPVVDLIDKMVEDGELIKEDERLYLPYYYYLENKAAFKLVHMLNDATNVIFDDDAVIQKDIENAEKKTGRELDEGQRQAVFNSIKNKVSIITGGPGTGKTTTLSVLLQYLRKKKFGLTLCAPTGRAAKRMTEQTGIKAYTIHSLYLRNAYSTNSKNKDQDKPNTEKDVIVVDESSMIDIHVLDMLLNVCESKTRLIFVGDVDQLPSIGPGQVLRDMIESGVIPTSRLTEIHRQADGSHIITNACCVINGKHLADKDKTDFFLAERDSEQEVLDSLKNYVTISYPNKLGVLPGDTQIIAPLRRGALGVDNMNLVMQRILNPPSELKVETAIKYGEYEAILREGDKVIQNKNDYSVPWMMDGISGEGVFNGEIGIIKAIKDTENEKYVQVEFAEGTSKKVAFYDFRMVRSLSLAYAITVHKSQGSEFKCVILPIFSYGMPMIYNRNLLYTAITRASQYCCIIGKEESVNKMIHNNKVNRRRTTLNQRLLENAK